MTPGPDNPFVKRKRWNQHLQAIHKDPSVLPLPYAQMSELGKALFDAGIGHAVSVDYGHLQVDNPDQELTNLQMLYRQAESPFVKSKLALRIRSKIEIPGTDEVAYLIIQAGLTDDIELRQAIFKQIRGGPEVIPVPADIQIRSGE